MSDSRALLFDIVIPTRNRCPYDPASPAAIQNPLVWTLESLAADPTAPLHEVMVIDDASTDHTRAMLEAFAASHPDLPLKHVRLNHRRGSASARNYGARVSSSEWVLFTDDDCVFSAGALHCAATLLATMRRNDPRAVALNLPYYLRRRTPARRMARSTIGVFEPHTGRICGNFDAVPEDEAGESGMAPDREFPRPMRITNLGCTILVDRHAFLDAGGFPEHLPCENSYGEETELAARLAAAGHHLYFAPDPKAHVVHMKYGAALPGESSDSDCALDFKILNQTCTLRQLCEWSNQVRADSGNRVDRASFAHSKIVSYFSIVQARSRIGALLWLCRAWREFVLFPARGADAGLSRWARIAVWSRAAAQGVARMLRPQVANGLSRYRGKYPS